MKKAIVTILVGVALNLVGGEALAHCQIPCGIYDDDVRFTLMLENVTTIEKSMTQIAALGKVAAPDRNQIVRWVDNKETHADKLAEIITYYFMSQRVKPVAPEGKPEYTKYVNQITLLHQMLVTTMKTKQTTDLTQCSELRRLIAAFRTSYTEH